MHCHGYADTRSRQLKSKWIIVQKNNKIRRTGNECWRLIFDIYCIYISKATQKQLNINSINSIITTKKMLNSLTVYTQNEML